MVYFTQNFEERMCPAMLQHKGTVRLESRRLLLRPFEEGDVASIFYHWSNDDQVTRHLRWQTHPSTMATEKRLAKWLDAYSGKDFYLWGIQRKEDGRLMGELRLWTVQPHDRVGEVAYCLGREDWGKGYAAEALQMVIRFAFEQVGFNRIQAAHSVATPASGRVLVKAGMEREGRCRQLYLSNVGYEDCDLYAVLRKDWEL